MEITEDVETQIEELKRLITSTTDEQRKKLIVDQIKDLEIVRESMDKDHNGDLSVYRRHSLVRPASSRVRKNSLVTVQEHDVVPVQLLSPELCRRNLSNISLISSSAIYDITSSSFDFRHEPTNIVDSKPNTFWISTGLFPQSISLQLRRTIYIDRLEIECLCVHKMRVLCSHSKAVLNPDAVIEEFPISVLENNRRVLPMTKRFDFKGEAIDNIRIEALSAYSEFCLVFSVLIYGEDEEKK